jgi:hypothetical protein
MRKGWRFWKRAVRAAVIRHRERSEAIQRCAGGLDRFAALAMTQVGAWRGPTLTLPAGRGGKRREWC